MFTATINSVVTAAGLSILSQATRQADGLLAHQPNLYPGKPGTLSTRTDDNTGIATLGSGHGITTAHKVDVYWATGIRYGMEVTAYDATTITVDLGAGEPLPVQGTAILVGRCVDIDSDFDSSTMNLLALGCDQRAHLHFMTEGEVSLLAQELAASEGFLWLSDQGITNPLASDVVGLIRASCGAAVATTASIVALRDSTP